MKQISQFGLQAEVANHAVPDMETVAGGLCAAINFIATKTHIFSFLKVDWIPKGVEEGAKKCAVYSFFQFAQLMKRNERGCWQKTGPFC